MQNRVIRYKVQLISELVFVFNFSNLIKLIRIWNLALPYWMSNEILGHGPSHALRVLKNSLRLCKIYNGNKFVVAASSLLMDCGLNLTDLHNEHELRSGTIAKYILKNIGVDDNILGQILQAIVMHRATANIDSKTSLETIILKDSDIVDRIGFYGIYMTFKYGMFINRQLYNLESPFGEDGRCICVDRYSIDYVLYLKSLYSRINLMEAKIIANDKLIEHDKFIEEFRNRLDRAVNMDYNTVFDILISNFKIISGDDKYYDYLILNRRTFNITAVEFEEKDFHRYENANNLIEKFVHHFHIVDKTKKILELGPGSGLALKLLNEKGFSTVGIEFAKRMAERIEDKYKNLTIINDEFLTYDFGTEKFDGLFAVAFIHLFRKKDAKRIISKAFELLKRNGVFLISTTLHEETQEGYFGKDNFSNTPIRFRIKYTAEDFEKLILKSKFKVVDRFENSDFDVYTRKWQTFILRKI